MSEELSARQQALKQKFMQERGDWNEDPDFFEAYWNFSSIPWRNGALTPKMKEFIYIAIDASTTHLFEPGLRLHIQNALKYGATQEEIMEVLECVSVLGIHTCAVGVPILAEELEKAKGPDPAK
jgi:alkylhydroperoxidase/carboxymuconolactone decarboxylase family protein YurZ